MIEVGSAIVELMPWGCMSSYQDGTSYGAHPHQGFHYYVIAHRCGYGDDVIAYAREHEVMHHLVGEAFYGGRSPVIWKLAHGEQPKAAEAALEEAMVMTLQRFVRAGERPIIGGVDWDALRARALDLLGERP